MSRAEQVKGEAEAPYMDTLDGPCAIDRLRHIVELAERADAARKAGEPLEVDTGHEYRVFLASLRERGDAHELHGDMDAVALIGRLASVHRWGSRAGQIDKLARTASAQHRLESSGMGDLLSDIPELDQDRTGAPKAHVANAIKVLRWSDEIGGPLRYNEFSGRLEWDGRPMADHDVTGVREMFQDRLGMTLPAADCLSALEYVGRTERAFHPVRDYLEGLTWDGVERVPSMLSDLLGALASPVSEVVALRWMVGAVRRVMEPGCKFDEMLILYGDQGQRKSAALRALCSAPWFGDTPLVVSASNLKDVLQAFPGRWIYEIQEVDQWTTHRNQSVVKAIMSSQVDYYRPSYGRFYVDWPRQTVLAGTTNVRHHLADPTGARRWWSVEVVEEIDVEAIADARDQLWAEAVERYRRGERSWMSAEERALQADAASDYQDEPSEVELVATWLERRGSREPFTTELCMREALDVPAERMSKVQRQAAAALRRLGYTQRRAAPSEPGGRRPRVWVRGD